MQIRDASAELDYTKQAKELRAAIDLEILAELIRKSNCTNKLLEGKICPEMDQL